MNHSLLRNFYHEQLVSLRQQSVHGETSIAKPMLILSIIDDIENNNLVSNKIFSEEIFPLYKKKCSSHGNGHIPFFYYPFYFLTSDGFYHLKWKGEPIKTNAPTGKLIRENVEYAYFDDALWNLLQNVSVREEYREAIISHYLK